MDLTSTLGIPEQILNDQHVSYCPVCETAVNAFKPFGNPPRQNAQCPHCRALERHRLVWCFFKLRTNLFDGRPKKLLHVAPERTMSQRIAKIPGIDSLTADLESPLAMVKMDLTNIQYPDESFDIILCSHVLEHIPDDAAAMREMLRVLTKEGWAAIQVPVYGETTYEDWSVTTDEDRLKHFGQKDHVRKYGSDIFTRLQVAGFKVEHCRTLTDLDPHLARKMRLKNQDIFFCRKA
jgi:SAM-dependent methyltransferase